MIEQMPIDCETCGGGGTAQSKWNGEDIVCPECNGKGWLVMEIQEISPDDLRAIWGAYADISEGNMDTARTTLHHFQSKPNTRIRGIG